MQALLASGLGEPTPLAEAAGEAAGAAVNGLGAVPGDLAWLVLGIVLIAATVAILFFLKNAFGNSVAGLVGWAVLLFLFKVQLPFYPSLVVSAVFGLAGLGAMLVLRFMGVL